MSIINYISEYADKRPSRWHTPGHKGTLSQLDVTELVCDSQLEKEILVAQEVAAQWYNVDNIQFLTGGSSIGIKAAILASGGDILCFKGCHQAILEGTNLAKVGYYEYNTGTTSCGLANVVTVGTIRAALKQYPQATAVYIESPDYYGRIVDKSVIDAIKAAGKLAFVDAAHGAHFVADSRLKSLCLAPQADIANLSAHKTLDAYTQTAYLAINNKTLLSKTKAALKNLGTTSPNYMLLASLESAIENAKKYDYDRLYKDIVEFKKQITCMPNGDFTRLVVDARAVDTNGEALIKYLVNKNIYAEKFTDNYVVFISTPPDTKNDLDNLSLAIKSFNTDRLKASKQYNKS